MALCAGRPADAIMHVWSEDMSGSGCDLTTLSGRVLKHGRLRTGAQYASCRVPVHPLQIRKRIRWKVGMSEDVAPRRGHVL